MVKYDDDVDNSALIVCMDRVRLNDEKYIDYDYEDDVNEDNKDNDDDGGS
jgi:hypothetical protein